MMYTWSLMKRRRSRQNQANPRLARYMANFKPNTKAMFTRLTDRGLAPA
jgi:hypothetical protein